MKTIPPEDFPPINTIVLEKTDRRVVLLHGLHGLYVRPEAEIQIVIWLRHVERVHPTVLGGWYASPDAGISLKRESVQTLLAVLAEALR